MSLEYANHVRKDANGNLILDANGNPITWTTYDADGKWAFQDKERRNLGYYQHLIREAANAGDLNAVIDYATKGAQYIGTTLVTRIDRELEFAKDEAVRHTRNNQYDAVLDEDLKRSRDRSELERDLSQVTRNGFTHLDETLMARGDELHVEMAHRGKSHLSLAIDLGVISHQIAGSNDILDNLSAQLDRASGIRYRERESNEYAFSDSGIDEFNRLNERLQNEDNQMVAQETQLRLLDLYGVDVTNADVDTPDWPDFDANGYEFVQNQYEGVRLIAEKFVGDPNNPTLHNLPNIPGYVHLDPALGTAPLELLFFRRVFGPIEVEWLYEQPQRLAGLTSEPNDDGIIRIEYYRYEDKDGELTDYVAIPRNVVHEYGHALDWRAGQLGRLRTGNEPFQTDGSVETNGSYTRHYEGFVENFLSDELAQNTEPTTGEDWGDSFMAWVYGDFASTEIGLARETVFEQWLGQAIGVAYGVGLGVDTNVVSEFIGEELGLQLENKAVNRVVSIRERPRTDNNIPVFATVATNTQINIIGYTDRIPETGYVDRWLLVEYNGVIGWIPSDSIDLDQTNLTSIDPDQLENITGRDYEINAVTFTIEARNPDGTVRVNEDNEPIEIRLTDNVWQVVPAEPSVNTSRE